MAGVSQSFSQQDYNGALAAGPFVIEASAKTYL
jgi:hypothetical protein